MPLSLNTTTNTLALDLSSYYVISDCDHTFQLKTTSLAPLSLNSTSTMTGDVHSIIDNLSRGVRKQKLGIDKGNYYF